MIITKQALPRRTFLRGMGATIALPLLDAMIPSLTALAQTAATCAAKLGHTRLRTFPVRSGFFILTLISTGTTRLAVKPHFLKRPKTKTVPVTFHSSFGWTTSPSAPDGVACRVG